MGKMGNVCWVDLQEDVAAAEKDRCKEETRKIYASALDRILENRRTGTFWAGRTEHQMHLCTSTRSCPRWNHLA